LARASPPRITQTVNLTLPAPDVREAILFLLPKAEVGPGADRRKQYANELAARECAPLNMASGVGYDSKQDRLGLCDKGEQESCDI
jgi:hypothetical protein